MTNTPVHNRAECGRLGYGHGRERHEDFMARANSPFGAVSYGARPETLIEAQLFGHVDEGVAGFAETREGYLKNARDGTLFLEEIGELQPDLQVKLLSVLRHRARVVLARHRDLGCIVVDGALREGLSDRSDVASIHTPRLCDVRALENLMQSAVFAAEGTSIQVSEVLKTIRQLDEPAFEDSAARVLRAPPLTLRDKGGQESDRSRRKDWPYHAHMALGAAPTLVSGE